MAALAARHVRFAGLCGRAAAAAPPPAVVAVVYRASRADAQRYALDPATGALARARDDGGDGARAGGAVAAPLRALAAPLLPRGFPDSVAPEYARYAAWNVAHQALGSAAGTLSTQALLMGAGLGAPHALPAAAALNWVLKDGVGQLATIGSAYLVADRFDAHPKQWRLFAAWLEDGARLVEMCAPLWPAAFLPIASAATVAKSVACLAASASKAAIHLSLSRRAAHANLADLTAKAGAQAVVGQLLGTALGVALSVGATLPAPQLAAPLAVALAAAHVATLAAALRCVTLSVADARKAELLAAAYFDGGAAAVPGPRALSSLDDGLLPPLRRHAGAGRVAFGGALPEYAADAAQLGAARAHAAARGHVLCAEHCAGSGRARARLLLARGAGGGEAELRAHMHAARLLRELDADGPALAELRAAPAGASRGARAGGALDGALRRAAEYADAHGAAYVRALGRAGWGTEHTLLDAHAERVAFDCDDTQQQTQSW